MGHVVGDQALQTVCLGDETTQLRFISRSGLWLNMAGLAQPIPIACCQRFLNAGEQLGDGFESDDYSPVSAAMCAQASRRSVRLLATNGSAVASLFRFACVRRSRQNS